MGKGMAVDQFVAASVEKFQVVAQETAVEPVVSPTLNKIASCENLDIPSVQEVASSEMADTSLESPASTSSSVVEDKREEAKRRRAEEKRKKELEKKQKDAEKKKAKQKEVQRKKDEERKQRAKDKAAKKTDAICVIYHQSTLTEEDRARAKAKNDREAVRQEQWEYHDAELSKNELREYYKSMKSKPKGKNPVKKERAFADL